MVTWLGPRSKEAQASIIIPYFYPLAYNKLRLRENHWLSFGRGPGRRHIKVNPRYNDGAKMEKCDPPHYSALGVGGWFGRMAKRISMRPAFRDRNVGTKLMRRGTGPGGRVRVVYGLDNVQSVWSGMQRR